MTIEWWQLFAILITGTYVAVAVLAALGLVRYGPPPRAGPSALPRVSIIVAARNEAGNIDALATSLLALDYPRDQIEILIADDDSRDDTAERVDRISRKHEFIKLVRVTSQDRSGLNGKANAIHQAIQVSSGEIVFVTDADCQVPGQWIHAHLAYYQPRTAMVGGFTLLTRPGGKAGLFARMQSLDWLFLIATGSGMTAWNRPFSIFGNNFSFRRSVYDQVGGYPAIGFSLVEDFALMQAMRQVGGKIHLPPHPGALVLSQPARGLRSFMGQRRRWALGFRGFSPLAKGIVVLGGFVRLLPLALVATGYWLWGGLVFAAISAADFLMLSVAALRLRRLDHLSLMPLLTPYQIIHNLILLPIFAFGRSVTWKDREYLSGE